MGAIPFRFFLGYYLCDCPDNPFSNPPAHLSLPSFPSRKEGRIRISAEVIHLYAATHSMMASTIDSSVGFFATGVSARTPVSRQYSATRRLEVKIGVCSSNAWLPGPINRRSAFITATLVTTTRSISFRASAPVAAQSAGRRSCVDSFQHGGRWRPAPAATA